MKRKEDQNFDLLEEIQNSAAKGATVAEEVISTAKTKTVLISDMYVSVSEIKRLYKLLCKVKKAETLEEVKQILTEDSIPPELIVVDSFWGSFQELIYQISK